jgi:pyruvate/2-oxoglutarate dehydrogenase complex dihydrolipoamide acyltransferase (E2) component
MPLNTVSITLPELGTTRATLSLWHVRTGENVFAGDRVAEILLPGATYDVPAPASGIIVERRVLPNDAISTGQVLGVIQADNMSDLE